MNIYDRYNNVFFFNNKIKFVSKIYPPFEKDDFELVSENLNNKLHIYDLYKQSTQYIFW